MREDWDNKPLTIEIVEGCAPEIGRLLWQLEVTRERLKEKLAGLDQATLDFALPNENSIGTLLYHIAAIEMSWLYEEVVETTVFPPEVNEIMCYDVPDEVRTKLLSSIGFEHNSSFGAECKKQMVQSSGISFDVEY